jgi:hypothetical protein
VTYVVLGLAYALGGAVLGIGIYLIRHSTFPAWWRRWMLWPLVRVTPSVTHLQGWAGVALGGSILAIGFTAVVPALAGGLLVILAMVGYLAGVVLFLYSTYLSRRGVA